MSDLPVKSNQICVANEKTWRFGMRKHVILSQLAMTLIVAGTGSVALADSQHYFIQMNVSTDESELIIKTARGAAGGCKFGAKKGCIRANKGDDVKFSLLLSGSNKCSLGDKSKWKLAEVMLGGKNSSGKPQTFGGFESETEVTSDFDFANKATGVLNPATANNDRQITIQNKNQYAYEVWYLVTADCVDKNGAVLKTITVDPRVVNEGKL